MFPRLRVLLDKLVPAKITHGWNIYKALAAFAALSMVLALVPLPQELPSGEANHLTPDIVVTEAGDTYSAFSECEIIPTTPSGGNCTLREAIDAAIDAGGSKVIGFDDGTEGENFNDGLQHTITLNATLGPLAITTNKITVDGVILDNGVKVIIDGGGLDYNLDENESPIISSCTNLEFLDSTVNQPILHITGDENVIYGLGFIKAKGNAIQIVDGDRNKIESNWIGTVDRLTDSTPEGNGYYGVCVAANANDDGDDEDANDAKSNEILGNIIVGSGLDGIRLQGRYASEALHRVSDTVIFSNLIGNLSATDMRDPDILYEPGNQYSGVTSMITFHTSIIRNVITNNGFFKDTEEGVVAASDGITLIEADLSVIAENYIGTFQETVFVDRGIDTDFPLPIGNFPALDIAVSSPTAGIDDYDPAPNACDGIGIRYIDHVIALDAAGGFSVFYECPESADDMGLGNKPTNKNDKYFTSFVGPSVNNKIFSNAIGYNERNGVYIQSLACRNEVDDMSMHFNLPNTMVGNFFSETSQYFVQNAKNSIVQNSIFRNDGSDTNDTSPITGTGTSGIGIDLEDYATATVFLGSEPFDIENSYWKANFPDLGIFDCSNDLFPVIDDAYVDKDKFQPATVSADSTEIDLNITENDDFANEPDDDAGLDPDAGANRLINHPFVLSEFSTPNSIVVRGAEGSWVDVYQVICTSGVEGDVVPSTDAGIRENCDTDYWNNQDGVGDEDTHTKGHGQGFRYLGSGFIPADPGNDIDDDYEDFTTIDPRDFKGDGNPNNDVHAFDGGLVVATTTGFALDTLCFDTIDDPDCSDQGTPGGPDGVAVGPAGIQAQDAGAPGTLGLWMPTIPDDDTTCDLSNEEGPILLDLLGLFEDEDEDELTDTLNLIFCLGSTSEFSPAAFIGPSQYTLEKHIRAEGPVPTEISPGDEVTYDISLSNVGATTIFVFQGALSDPLPPVIDMLVDCTVEVLPTIPSGTYTCEPGTLQDPINMTSSFGPIPVAPGEILLITITGRVKTTIADPEECTFRNEVFITDLFLITDPNSNPATETGSMNHVSEPLDVTGCPTPGQSDLEKQVSVDGGTFVDADTAGSAEPGERGESVDYLIHFTNNSGTGAVTYVNDTFPSYLTGVASVTCWRDTGDTRDDTYDSDSDTTVPCSYIGTPTYAFDFDTFTPATADPFLLPDGETLHILVTGFSIDPALLPPGPNFCNTANVVSGDEQFNDDACAQVLDPALDITKFVAVSGTESSQDTVTGAPSVSPGTPITYYIDVSNTSVATLTNVSVTDALPAGIDTSALDCDYNVVATISPLPTHTSVTYPNNCTFAGGTLSGITLSPGQTLYVRLQSLAVSSSASAGAICNQAQASSDNLNDNDTACINVLLPNLTILKTVSNSTPNPGSTITYNLQVTNNASTPVNNVQIVDNLGDAADDIIPRCVATSADILSASGGTSSTIVGNVVTWNIGTLAASGGSSTVSVTVRLRGDLASGTNCRNIAIATGTNVTSVQDDATITIPTSVGQTTVTLEKEATNDHGDDEEPDVFDLGDTVKYEVTVRNTGTAAISNLTVRDSIPEEEEDLDNVVATSGAVNNSELGNDRLEVGAISINAGASQTVDYEVSVLDEGDFPLDNYDLDSDAEMEDDDFYPEDVEDDDIGTSSNYDDPEDALSAPDGHFVSLGEDGEITLSVSDEDDDEGKLIVDGDGDDFCVVEIDPSVDTDGTTEEYEVEVSQTDDSSDFESVGSQTSNSDCFDLGDADMTWARFVRITDTSGTVRGNAPGSDIDAVCLLNLGGFVINTAGLYSGSSLVTTADERILVDFTDAFENPLDEGDCQPVKELREPIPTPQIPPAVPPSQIPFFPFAGLPTTGPEGAAVPLASGILGLIAWVMKRRKF
ncbi:MAG: hypothetical protein A2V81_00970 [Candidatus Abawacabacteria bacterium RBG_16_42_10]|uniref:DUF11 domain-containing protein n=1 Tax=Candidatus Abawacabacteria bacterium RBG_16_42_10 TaxID=1817814 RepID=A0A1F4XLD5_9BACT|nr:MAG: hypothetical protein A2V81_00970 [Candidatus Abawacabacteria bacterium RBG_16_42_10]